MPENESDDVLSREVAITAKLEENGVTVRTRSRAVAALDRLAGSIFDLPAAFFEGRAGKRRLKDSIEQRLLQTEAIIAERKLEAVADAGEGLLQDLARDRARKLSNAAGVAVEAIEAMKALPPPKKKPAESEGGPAEAPEPPLDDDWLNSFVRYAEDATSDDLQQIWGRVLAGEINCAGSFSRFTLRFIAELDRETAQACEEVAQYVIGDFIPKTDLWQRGQGLARILELQQLGLVEGATGIGGLQKSFSVGPLGHVMVGGRHLALVLEGAPGTVVQTPSIILTRVGRQVFSLLEIGNEAPRFALLAEAFSKTGLRRITRGRIEPEADSYNFFPQLVLWTEGT